MKSASAILSVPTAFVLFLFVPLFASAAVWSSPFEVSGWIPYWRAATGTAETLQHLDTFKEINPFGYTMTAEGRLADTAVMSQEPWTSLKAEAAANHIRFIPTVMWSDRDAIHATLKDTAKRQLLVRIIVDEVNVNGYDGIDIDFENKSAETKPYFSLFLKELYKAMGDKWVQCTIEARTPLDSRYLDSADIPEDLSYANDFAVIAKNCDRVRFMTYDQQTVDQKLGEAATQPYGPVSDVRWVEKAVKEAAKTIPKRKIVIGIPTYGYEWKVTTYANNEHVVDLLWTFNPQYGWDLANEYNITPGRNEGGELGFTYIPKTSPVALPRPMVPWPWNLIASAASALTNASNTNMTYRMVTWSDAQAIQDKVALAKKLGVRGVAIFKIDGGEDQGMWDVLK
ncbi:hypothetical protein A3A38_03535 [Candidatus Kaiserbacteria bacterium RIFCSPLOWO2_01_FULL_53_17]|uniref:GH18 domain-containing protein n=1 Tax=Candidatus Kaiserbacteria bacterium RIFCSPLOWO2_01_FULL_53_17 TaxID=1798511 RepID=A0A1F6EGL8_9BACT|nr:MAG: hypothetical protein A3A38_03535 [Candidatus Kaiserbacteria bacterium RIFCSPLOWO2_01_FULL_53_17]